MQDDQQAVTGSDMHHQSWISLFHDHAQIMDSDVFPGSYEKERVTLQPSIDYLVSTPLLDALGNMVAGHLKNKYNHYVTIRELDELTKYCADKNVYGRPEEVKLPAPGVPIFQMITSPCVGITCTISTDCYYAVCDLDTIK
ncbi:uncharacterized protein F5147DRAFT_652934 [Suillus discolor]|uniref:Uncharacterized protein n=1 Tax=Suillus discolor TaxID=1912936 RepID=A0A9P7F7T0_9AGAM|nr:uncharacterized protein F5147DRAFT_652934 [Suillus discolor]KAG2108213.1 hypothetical protein F5147DRAFT_652934 [Suillus discolor]